MPSTRCPRCPRRGRVFGPVPELVARRCALDVVPNVARPRKVTHAMSNSFGFGGTNATLLFSAFEG